MVTDQQVALLRQRQMEGKKQQTAAAMAGMSERSARKWQCGPLPSETKQERRWRTRPDPFDGVWEEEILPLLRGEAAGRLRATAIIEWLEEKFPGRFSASQLRTLQRRLQDWRALNGPDQEVYFPQEHPPGREAQVDFTHCNSLGVTIGSRRYRHLLFQLVLSHSGWRYAEVVAGETFVALKQGLQNALWELGGAPQVKGEAAGHLVGGQAPLQPGDDLLTQPRHAVQPRAGPAAGPGLLAGIDRMVALGD